MLRQFKNLVSSHRFSYNGFSRFCALANLKDDTKLSKLKSPMVAKAFESLSDETPPQQAPTKESLNLDETINNAKTVNGLLNVSQQKGLDRKHALKIVSILAEWTTIERANLNDFENDARFTKLCRMLGKTIPNNRRTVDPEINENAMRSLAAHNADIDTILNITGVDKASKLVNDITLDQMVKVMKNLALKKRRSTPLLNSLSINICGKVEQLNLKQCSDVLYAMAMLNFSESNLITKICNDILASIKTSDIKKSSIIGSMLKSLALLKARDIACLDSLGEWIIENQSICRTQDLATLILSLAALNYTPIELESAIKDKIVPYLTPMDFKSSQEYLVYVWSLMALNIIIEPAFSHVLKDDFIERLKSDFSNDLSPSAKLKLLNVNAGVQLFMPNYKGNMLDRTKHKEIYDTHILYNHDKQLLVKAMIDALKSLVPANQLQTNLASNMGFNIDAQFYVDKKGKVTVPKNPDDADCKKIAVLCLDYHDYCQGPHLNHTGLNALNIRLLERQGVSTIIVPYFDFSPNDLLVKRVQYLQMLIKNVSKVENT